MKSTFETYGPFTKLLFLIFIMIISFFAVFFIGILFLLPIYGAEVLSVFTEADYSDATYLSVYKYIQILSHLGLFIVPAILYAFIAEKGFKSYYAFNKKISLPIIVMGSLIIVLALPLVNYLGDINKNIVLPESMKAIENWMQKTELLAEEMIKVFLADTSFVQLIVNLLMIAVIPAIGEELIFRGILLKSLNKMTSNIHIAAFVSAIIFSAVHMQFYGFLPRMVLGLVLAYLFIWSGSIWVPIIAHFANNALAVMVAYFHNKGVLVQSLENFGNFSDQNIFMLMFVIFFALAIFMFYFVNRKTNPNFNKI